MVTGCNSHATQSAHRKLPTKRISEEEREPKENEVARSMPCCCAGVQLGICLHSSLVSSAWESACGRSSLFRQQQPQNWRKKGVPCRPQGADDHTHRPSRPLNVGQGCAGARQVAAVRDPGAPPRPVLCRPGGTLRLLRRSGGCRLAVLAGAGQDSWGQAGCNGHRRCAYGRHYCSRV